MQKRLLSAGIAVMVVGIFFMWAGNFAEDSTFAGISSLSESGTAMTTGPLGILHSKVLNVTNGEEIFVETSGQYYLIPTKYIGLVSPQNIGNYDVYANEHLLNGKVYSDINGSYYLVTFQNSYKVLYTVTSMQSSDVLALEMDLSAFGILVLIGGVIVAIVGALGKQKN